MENREFVLPLVAAAAVCLLPPMQGQAKSTGEPFAAEAIMARVARNQDRIEAQRGHYVYVQRAHVASRKGRIVICEETTESRVTPSEKGSAQELLKLNGRLLEKGRYVVYTSLPAPVGKEAEEKEDHGAVSIEMGDADADRQMVEHMRANLLNDKTRDGINGKLFPLTSKEQAMYAFHLVGREPLNGREVFHLRFTPRDTTEFGWKGDAYIDTTEFEPVVVRTDLSRKIPMAVRLLLGTNVPGLGFSVVYAPQLDGVWMPTSFGTEFKVRALFFFHRDLLIDAKNYDFETTHVQSTIVTPEEKQPSEP